LLPSILKERVSVFAGAKICFLISSFLIDLKNNSQKNFALGRKKNVYNEMGCKYNPDF